MGLWVQLPAVTFVSALVSTPHPTAGGRHDPLLVLDGYENDGIRLKCFSERLLSEVQVLWTDGRGDNITATPLTTGTTTATASSSVLLKPGAGNSASCKIIDKLLRTSTESSVVIADAFFPVTSPWLPAFVVLLFLSIFLVITAIYQLRKNQKTMIRETNAQGCIQNAEEQKTFENANQKMLAEIERIRQQLEFCRARSNAVNITLDENCKHPSLMVKEKNRVRSSSQAEIPPEAVVLATEGFSGKKHYWEVEVGNKSEWGLGVLGEEMRNTLRTVTVDPLSKENTFSLWFSKGEYSFTGGTDIKYHKVCSVVGVFLDLELNQLSFFDAEEKYLLKRLSLERSGTLYPFFSPGADGKWLGVRPVMEKAFPSL
ncbi:butyrophilin subfamily 3 member A3 isoform X2 [Cuculus canorus]|uniref:butyrophilin subfamily 3 member A3 isoform X2 n=1 Tax=Cuculus canorus TaxID=55661 RepID=UPI0023AA2D22|nr:butyrophilin subfamily 3 member A3 isoform X2 [Cuculus canorus]